MPVPARGAVDIRGVLQEACAAVPPGAAVQRFPSTSCVGYKATWQGAAALVQRTCVWQQPSERVSLHSAHSSSVSVTCVLVCYPSPPLPCTVRPPTVGSRAFCLHVCSVVRLLQDGSAKAEEHSCGKYTGDEVQIMSVLVSEGGRMDGWGQRGPRMAASHACSQASQACVSASERDVSAHMHGGRRMRMHASMHEGV